MMLRILIPGRFIGGPIHGQFTSLCNASSPRSSSSQCSPKASLVSKGHSIPPSEDRPISNIKSHKCSEILTTGVSPEIETISSTPIAPMKLESPAGQFLVSTLQSNPHLFDSVADHELDLLAAKEKDASREIAKVSGHLPTLYRRIADVKADERRVALREFIYALVIQKFVKAGITLTPDLSGKGAGANLESASHEKQLETVHSLEALDMIKDHLYSVIEGKKGISLKLEKGILGISKFLFGQLYASSIVYGYFIRRVDRKFQLERRMEDLALASNKRDAIKYTDQTRVFTKNRKERGSSKTFVGSGLNRPILMDEGFSLKLRDYVSSFDPEVLDQCATLRFKESLDVLEKHVEALFGRPNLPMGRSLFCNSMKIHLDCSQLRLLVLEAVAFGSFLWDAECHVESKCTLHPFREEI